MTKHTLPLIAILVALPLLVILSAARGDMIPLMAKLFMGEFGAILCAAGVYAGITAFMEKGFVWRTTLATAVCAVLAVRFALLTIDLWPL
ncbi:MAG: hypothetical protein ACWA44_16265 [Thiotrichales bacterium]